MSVTTERPSAASPGGARGPRVSARAPEGGGLPPRAPRSASARRRDARSGAWAGTTAVAAAFGAALLGLAPLLQGFDWWFATMAMVVVLLGLMAVLRSRGAPELLVLGSAIALWAVLVIVLYAGSTLWLVFPTADTFADLGADLAAARTSIAVQAIPAVADPPITQLMVMAVGLIAIVSDELANGLRAAALSATGPLAVLAISPIIRRGDPDVPVYVLTAAALLAVLWFSSRIGRSGPGGTPEDGWSRPTGRNRLLALGIAAASIAAMVVLPAVTPGLTARSLADDSSGSRFPSVYSTGVDPTIQLGRDLRRSDPVLSLSYTTTSEDGLYLKMVNLGDFTTGTWLPESPLNSVGYDGQEFGTPPGLAPDVPTVEATTDVAIAALKSDWLPLPYPTQRVDALEGDWLLTPSTLTVTDLEGDTRGLDYSVTGLSIQPTAEQLAAAGATVPDSVSPYLAVPDGLPPVIAETAAQVAAEATTNYDQAVALQEYFRSPQFTYSLSAPLENGYDADNGQAIADFLEAKSGYCVHFAASMAVMARTLGIPSRIAVGYAPGQNADSTKDGEPVYEVYTDQLHAWPELYFDGIGWLPFEPTPGLDITPPDYSLPDYAQAGSTSATDPSQSQNTATSTAAPDRADALDVNGAQSPEQRLLGQLRSWGVFAAILGGVVLVGLTPWAVRSLRRRSRIWRLSTDLLPGTLAWTELEDTVDDYRLHRGAGDTPHDLVTRLVAERTLPEPALERLRRQVEFEQFAPPGSADAATRARIRDDLREFLSALEGGAPRSERYRARLTPLSLWRRSRTSSAAGSLVP